MMDQAALYQTQISFTEWFENIKHEQTEEIRREDNEKRERLKVLQQYLQLPYDKPVQFLATDLTDKTPAFRSFLQEWGGELCALRLIPLQDGLPKFRLRGTTIRKVMGWFAEQAIDPVKYRVEFVPHSENTLWSTIFVVNSKGVFGEAIHGNHYQLTQGFYEQDKPLVFCYDFLNWSVKSDNKDVLAHLKGILKRLKVVDPFLRETLQQELQATFANQYLCGYFETVFSLEHGLWFCDYNRILGKMYEEFQFVKGKGELSGVVAYPGKVQGKVQVVLDPLQDIKEGGILVCDMTTPAYVPLMKKAGAIITQRGGILTHAAIVARELGKPCIVGVERVLELLKEGDVVEVDGEKGLVRKVSIF